MEIPGYTIIRELGSGGMATVYLANQYRLQRQVALKVMKPISGAVDDFAERFVKEGQIIAQLKHRQIVTIYDFNSLGDLHYFSMEYLPGGTLSEQIKQGIPINRCLIIIRSIAQALYYAHERGIIHRDIKPQNIMFQEDGSPVLTDFGIARVVNASSDTTRLTRFGMAIGSPRYMSPEQITSQTVDARSDLYSLGIVFYEMLTRELPFHAEEVISLAMMHCKDPIPSLPDEVAVFQPILDKLTAKKPEERFADAGQLIRVIDQLGLSHAPDLSDDATRIIGSAHTGRKPHPAATAPSRKRAAIGVLFLLLVGVAIGAYLIVSRSPDSGTSGPIIDLPPESEDRSVIAANYEKLAIAHIRVGELEKSLGLINLGLSATPGDNRLQTLQTMVQTKLKIAKLRQNAQEFADKNLLEQSLELVDQGLNLAPDQQDLLKMREDLQSRLHAEKLRRMDEIAEQARELRNKGDLDESLELIERGLDIVSEHDALLALRSDVQRDLQRRSDVAKLVVEASGLLKADQLDESLSRVEKGLQLEPDHAVLKRLRADIEERKVERKNERAAELLEQALAQRQDDPFRGLELVEDGLSEVPTNAALLSLRDMLRRQVAQQQSIAKLYGDAQEREQQGDLAGSLALIERGLALDPEHRGLLDLRSAIERVQRRIHQDRSVAEFLAQAREQQQLGALAKAMEHVEKGLKLTPGNRALQDLQQRIQEQIDTNLEVARLISEAEELVDRDSAEKGLGLINRALELAPENQQARELEAELSERETLDRNRRVGEFLEQATELEAQKSFQEGLHAIDEGLELEPTHPELLALRKQLTVEFEEKDRIQRLVDECANRFPMGPSLRSSAEPAIACYQQVLDLDPRNATAGAKQREIEGRLPEWINALLREGDLGLAENLLAFLSRIKPQQAELPVLRRTMAEAEEASLELNPSQRQKAQTWLNALGYAAGDADGAFGTKTRSAISAFQRAAGSEATGFLDADILPLLEDQGARQLLRSMLPRMVDVEGGCFQMGSPSTEETRDNDERQHRVCVKDYRLGEQEVTVKEFRKFVEATGYRTDAERNAWGHIGCWALDVQDDEQWNYRDWANWRKPHKYEETKEDHPVTCVSWNDARAYVDWLSRKSGASVRLPTEAEWEYAARAGTSSTRFWGNNADETACRFASVADVGHQWTSGFPCDDGYEWVAPVGKHQPNPWGVYDIFGNVLEWTCSDYDPEYSGNEQKCTKGDGEVPRALRGGSWYSGPSAVRAAYRDRNYSGTRYNFLGFRIAEDLAPADLR